jgi:trehalose monomycolate/heme transporter
MLDRWSRILVRRPLAVLLAGLVLTLAAGAYGAGVFDSLSQGGFDDPDSESSAALEREREALGNQGVDVVAIYSSEELTADDPAFRAEVESVLSELPEGTTVQVVPWYAEGAAPDLVSRDGHAAQVLVSLEGTSQDEYLTSYDELAPALEADTLETDLAGSYAIYDDVNERTEEDLRRAETVSLPIVAVLAVLIFGSLVAASMPVLVGALSVVGALAVVRLITEVTEVSIFSVNVITLLGMGLAIDYALFVVSRFREELARHPADDPGAVGAALTVTMQTAGRTVLFSGLTVAAAMSSLLVFPQAFLRSMGYGGIAAVLVAMVAALTVLPAVLRLLGRRIDKGRVFGRRGSRPVEDGHGAWARIASAVMRRPVTVLVVVTVGLVALASPFLGVKWGSVDHRILPPDSEAYVAAEKLATEFGPETASASLLLDGTEEADVAAYTRAVEGVDGVAAVQPVASADGVTLLRAVWEGEGQSQASQQLVAEVRDVDPASGEVLVGGLTAETVDLEESVASHLPWMGVVVVLVMVVLLFIAFGSLVLPIKAVLMNALSITASFGVVTWIFSDGNLEGLLDFSSQGFLDLTNPILMLAILFGLSMDYEVFLLSRVREEWDASGDNDRAVSTGVQKTGRIITSAALLLAVVIGAFSFSGVLFMKMIGVGMLVALLIDATVVRALLVPATMKLLGRWNWWAPGPMVRWWERYGFRESAPAEPAPAPARPLADVHK